MKSNEVESKESNRIIYIRFACVLIISLVLGFFAGMFSSIIKNLDIKPDREMIFSFLNTLVPIIYCVFTVALIAACMIIYAVNRKQAKAWDGEDEDVIDRIEARQNIPMVLSSILMVVGMFFFSLCVYIDSNDVNKNKYSFIFFTLVFILNLAGSIIIQSFVINLEKELNPEKKGNVFDFNFLKKWEKSSDEGEKLIQYKSGYKAYLYTNFVCMVLWLVTSIGVMMFDTGILAVACVCIIWLFMSLVYAAEVSKLEKRKSAKK